jgi:LPS-assembly protein
MMYFEDARLEFFGVPVAYMPYFSTPDPTAKRKTGFLMPSVASSSIYGVAVTTPYYWALAPNYDLTISPTITSRQGPLLQGEFRQRLMDGAYTIRAAGIFQLDRSYFPDHNDAPGDRDFRGDIQTSGQFALSNKWVWGWDVTAPTDQSFFRDYRITRINPQASILADVPDYALSQIYLAGRGDTSYFDVRSYYFYGFSASDDQKQIPIVHPVLDHDYTVGQPILGGVVTSRSNITSLSRESANFDPISALAVNNGFCTLSTADPAQRNLANCVLRGVPGEYNRASNETTWKTTYIDPFGQVFKPFVSLRTDVASVNVSNQPDVSNYMKPGDSDVARVMPAVGVEYRYPFISAQSWGTQTIEPIAQVILRPNETGINKLPNEDSQSLIFDESNLFSVNKYSGWDRVEG